MPRTSLVPALFATSLLLGAACNGRQPLPAGAPPEYEPPRDYQPKRNVDKPASGADDDLGIPLDDPEGPPPPPPPLAPEPAAGGAAPATEAGGAGGGDG
jgi:hypothetical protein